MKASNLAKYVGVSALLLFIGMAARADDEHGLFATQVQLDSSEIVPVNGAMVAAFIPTGSDSEVCFVNHGDSGFYMGSFEPPICIRRTYAGEKGLVVIVNASGWVLPSNFVMRVSVYQRGAKFYGEPVAWWEP